MRGCLIRPDIGRQHSEAIREIDIQIHLEERLLLVSALSQGEGQSKPYRRVKPLLIRDLNLRTVVA